MFSVVRKIAWFSLKKLFLYDVLAGVVLSLILASVSWVLWFMLAGFFGYDPIPFWMTARVLYVTNIALGLVYRFLWFPYWVVRDSKTLSSRWDVPLEEVVDAFLYKGLEPAKGKNMSANQFKQWRSIHDMVERLFERSPLFR